MENEKYKALTIKQLIGDASDMEIKELEAWRAASRDNEELYSDYAKIFNTVPTCEPKELPVIAEEWLGIVEILDLRSEPPARLIELRHPAPVTAQPRFAKRLYWSLAAALVVILLGSLVFNRLTSSDGVTEVFAASGKEEQVELPDGSRVRLNSVSRISYDAGLSGGERVIQLTGEAFFEVEKDGRPFVVRTEHAQIRVLGTAFNVWARDDETRVIVEEGRVALEALEGDDAQPLLLSVNQMGIFSAGNALSQPIEIDAAERLGWLHGRIVFSRAPLSDVVAELQRLYDVEITLSDGKLGRKTLTASFSKKSIDSVLASVCLAMHLRFIRQGQSYIINEF